MCTGQPEYTYNLGIVCVSQKVILDEILKKIDGRRAEYSCMKVVIISTKKICQVDLTRPLNTDVDAEEDAAIAMIGKTH